MEFISKDVALIWVEAFDWSSSFSFSVYFIVSKAGDEEDKIDEIHRERQQNGTSTVAVALTLCALLWAGLWNILLNLLRFFDWFTSLEITQCIESNTRIRCTLAPAGWATFFCCALTFFACFAALRRSREISISNAKAKVCRKVLYGILSLSFTKFGLLIAFR